MKASSVLGGLQQVKLLHTIIACFFKDMSPAAAAPGAPAASGPQKKKAKVTSRVQTGSGSDAENVVGSRQPASNSNSATDAAANECKSLLEFCRKTRQLRCEGCGF